MFFNTMAKLGCVLLLLAHLVALSSLLNPDQPQQAQLDKVVEHASSVYQDIARLLEKNFPNAKQVSDKFVQQSKQFLGDVKQMVDNFKAKIGEKPEQLKSVLSQISTELSEHVAKMERVIGPDAAETIEQIKVGLENCFRGGYEGMKKIVEAFKQRQQLSVRDRVLGFAQRAYSSVADIAKVARHRLQRTVAYAEKALL